MVRCARAVVALRHSNTSTDQNARIREQAMRFMPLAFICANCSSVVSLVRTKLVFGLAQLLEQIRLARHRQRLGGTNRALHRSVISGYAARSYQLDVEHFASGQ